MAETVSSPSRRNFFKRFTLEPEVKLPETCHPRPPWSRDNKHFLSVCDRCNQCVDACPQKVLRQSEETDPILNALPVLILDSGSCDFCGKCAEACPSGALSLEDGRKQQAVAVLNNNCSAGYGYPCQMCAEACEEGAITPPQSLNHAKGVAKIDTDKCTGCGECALSCYRFAISVLRVS